MTTKELIEELIKYNEKGKLPIAWGLGGGHYQLSDLIVEETIERLKEYDKLEEHRNHIEHCPPRNN